MENSRCQEALVMHISKYHQDSCTNKEGPTTENIRNCFNVNKIENNKKSSTTDEFSPPHSPEGEEKNVMKKVKCKQCGILLNNYSKLEWHLRRVHSQTSVFCPKCKRYFPPNHLNKNHPDLKEQRFYKCRLCDRQFLDKSDNLKYFDRNILVEFAKQYFYPAAALKHT